MDESTPECKSSKIFFSTLVIERSTTSFAATILINVCFSTRCSFLLRGGCSFNFNLVSICM